MKLRYLVAAGAATALVLTACSSTGSGGGGQSSAATGTLTVWLQTDAQQGWPEAVAAATTAFNAKHPGVTVDVQYQSWGDHLTKLDASLAGSTPPDVVELGNTQTAKYMAAGAFADITGKKASSTTPATWLKSLEDSSTFDGKLYGVPYYAGSRVVIYRKDVLDQGRHHRAADQPGRVQGRPRQDQEPRTPPTRSFSAFYMPGKYWYAAM